MNNINNSVNRFPSIEQLNQYVISALIDSCKQQNPHLILSGGRSPLPIYSILGKILDRSSNPIIVPSDERRVPISNDLSNEGMIKKYFINLEEKNYISLHDLSAKLLLNKINEYELSLLGFGTDGHFASIFPNMDNLENALHDTESLVRVDSGFPDVPRISLTLGELSKAKKTLLLATSKNKLDLILAKRSKFDLLPIDYLIKSVENIEILTLNFD